MTIQERIDSIKKAVQAEVPVPPVAFQQFAAYHKMILLLGDLRDKIIAEKVQNVVTALEGMTLPVDISRVFNNHPDVAAINREIATLNQLLRA